MPEHASGYPNLRPASADQPLGWLATSAGWRWLVTSALFSTQAWQALNQVEHQWQVEKKKLTSAIASVDDDELETEQETPNHPPPPLPPPPPAPAAAAHAPAPASATASATASARGRPSSSSSAAGPSSPSGSGAFSPGFSPGDKADTTAQKRKRRWRELAGNTLC